jgi:hypothetical protein
MPVGPWLLVVGMHRSGTSAVTGALGHLGLAVPPQDDRWEPSEDNPEHWESRALSLYSDVLLEQLGGTWDRPPDPDLGWESDPDLTVDKLGDPSEPASDAFPNPGPLVWKDPRTCLLLPYWLAHLPQPVAAVFIWRSPLSVARSLQARDRTHLADGVALWERYNRSALAGLIGVDTFVTRYESIVEDPLGGLGDIASWLGSIPQFSSYAPRWDLAAAVESISPGLLRQQATDSELLLDEQRQLIEDLEQLEGPHRPLTSAPSGAESPWTTAVLGDRHQMAALSRQRDTLRLQWYEDQDKLSALNAELQTTRADLADMRAASAEMQADLAELRSDLAEMVELYERMRASTSWRITRPFRQCQAYFGQRLLRR